jgi:hypothetical protein
LLDRLGLRIAIRLRRCRGCRFCRRRLGTLRVCRTIRREVSCDVSSCSGVPPSDRSPRESSVPMCGNIPLGLKRFSNPYRSEIEGIRRSS